MSQTIRDARVIALVVAVLALGAGVSVAQPRQVGGITVSDDVNFEGTTMTFVNDVPDLRDVALNDRISSLRVTPGEAWEVCEDANYRGRCIVVSSSERDLRTQGLNDAITSMRRVEGREVRDDRDDRRGVSITVYDDVNFRGATMTFRRDVPDLRDVQFNDRISSLQVVPGESWEVCEDANYRGRCIVVSGSERDLRALRLNDVITSIRRVPGRDDRRR
jgi:beta/gamma crystallin